MSWRSLRLSAQSPHKLYERPVVLGSVSSPTQPGSKPDHSKYSNGPRCSNVWMAPEGQLTLGQSSGCQWCSRLSKGMGICPCHACELWQQAWDGRFAELHTYGRENQGTALASVEIWALTVEADSAVEKEKVSPWMLLLLKYFCISQYQ